MEVTNDLLTHNLIDAKVIADSISPNYHRVTTFEVCIHRFVLAELNTHRVFSRNSASSRAIPVPKRMQEFAEMPAFSINLPAEQPGMQGGSDLQGQARADARQLLWRLHNQVRGHIEDYLTAHPEPSDRLHKSVLARYMEPWLWHRVIITATDWDGFFAQRVSTDAQPEIHLPALLMQEAYNASLPVALDHGEWHLPYVQLGERTEFGILDLVKLSTARCARVSYLTHDGNYDPEKDIKLWDRLTSASPPHASPLEHPCRVDESNYRYETWEMLDGTLASKSLPKVGNLMGFMQARHLVLGF